MKIKLIPFFVMLLVAVKLTFADAECDSTIASCLPDTKVASCNISICFVDSKSRKQYEDENNCKIGKEECSNEIKEIPLSVLQQIFPSSTSILNAITDELNIALKLIGAKRLINTKRKMAHFLAQVKQEVGSGANVTESLNYTPEKLIQNFKYYMKHPEEAVIDGRVSKGPNKHKANQVAIANKAYANRGGNGSVTSGDGWKYRGRGLIQLTFKNNYQSFNSEYKKIWKDSVDFVKNPELIVEDKYIVRSALSYWKTHDLTSIAEKGVSEKESREITAKINMSTKSYDARFENLNEIMNIDFFKECK